MKKQKAPKGALECTVLPDHTEPLKGADIIARPLGVGGGDILVATVAAGVMMTLPEWCAMVVMVGLVLWLSRERGHGT